MRYGRKTHLSDRFFRFFPGTVVCVARSTSSDKPATWTAMNLRKCVIQPKSKLLQRAQHYTSLTRKPTSDPLSRRAGRFPRREFLRRQSKNKGKSGFDPFVQCFI